MKKSIQLGSAFSVMRPFHLHEQVVAYNNANLEMNHKQGNICWNKVLIGRTGIDEFPIIEKMLVILPFFILS
ncbi:hypothetical protein [Peribacillus simplex]|uniref:hypothetical protein n=1 Tax=Peribacillus simplex TaxID=1478 RepID=UPI0011DCEA82|nr:hypothetical protein [Peribacillus simplex]